MADKKTTIQGVSDGNIKTESSTKGNLIWRKVLVMTITVLYFIAGFFTLVILLGRSIGSNYAGWIVF